MDREHVEFSDYFGRLAHRKRLIVAGDALKRAPADRGGSQYVYGSDRERINAATASSGGVGLAFATPAVRGQRSGIGHLIAAP